ncbi:SMI1/KNR4 family protein (plasmid) [Komagataeibacter sucrofermentans]|uniref:SMI1/KNR4 family protein n=1 Tax=Komagataeibacter sucrofermentans TaxID=1053551 RepID=UPI00142E30C9|nr:SMI1/KNR4 family protein [Komagataeibacter sucrofermentans]
MIELKKFLVENGALFTPASEDDILALERDVNFPVSEDYKFYLKEFGTILFKDRETYGLGVPETYYLNVLHAYQALQRVPEFPGTMLPLAGSGDGAWYLYDNEERKVFSWQIAGIAENIEKSMLDFLQFFLGLA